MSELMINASGLEFAWPAGVGGPGFQLKLDAWEVRRGARVAVHGPSGCGKSTLLSIVAGALLPSAGRLTVAGLDMLAADEARRRAHRISCMGMVFQDFPLVPHLSALENVLLPYRLNPALELGASARRRARSLLGELGLEGREAAHPGGLSQGERQRVAIARALVTEPTLLLADEPTAGLDPARSQGVVELMEGLTRARDLTLVIITHDTSLLPRFDEVLNVGVGGGL